MLWALNPLCAQTIWNGNVSTAWTNPSNWSDGVPDAADAVTIPDVTRNPTISLAGAIANSISVESGGVLSITAAGTLTVNGGINQAIQNFGTVTCSGVITVDATTSYGIRNDAIFNNTGGQITINHSSALGLFNSSGTFTNTGTITIGNMAGIGIDGISNNATFNNNTGGQINIDRTGSRGIWNNSGGTFTNLATITIGATADIGLYGINNSATFNNNASGQIYIDRASSAAILNDGGTFNSRAGITIGATANAGNGIRNVAAFNHTSGTIRIDYAFSGIFNNTGGIFTNQSIIIIGATSSPGQEGIHNTATFTNGTGGQISIDRSTSTGLFNNIGGNFTNQAVINIGSTAPIGTRGISNRATFTNNTGGQIKIDQFSSRGLSSESSFTNQATITIGSVASTGVEGIYNTATFDNNTGGQINIDRCALTNFTGGTFTNRANITLGATVSPGARGIQNFGTFSNSTGGQINIDRSTSTGVYNAVNCTFTNQATINIGTTASAGSNGIVNYFTFNNSAGQININQSTLIAILNVNGATFNNAANLSIGPVCTGNNFIANQGNFNHNGGQMSLNGSPSTGLLNSPGGTFTNNASLTICSSSGAVSSGIHNEGTFNNNTGSSIQVDRFTDYGIENFSAFTNAANITIGGIAGTGLYGITNTSVFNNNTGGLIRIDRCTTYGLNTNNRFNNHATLTIGSMSGVGTYGIRLIGRFDNDGLVQIDRTTTAAIAVIGSSSQFFNYGTVRVGATASVGTYGIYMTVGPDFFNEQGAQLHIDRAGTGVYAIDNGLFDNSGDITIGALAPVAQLIKMQTGVPASPIFRHILGTIKGSGALSSGFLCSGGTLAPGNSPGIMTIESPGNGLSEGTLIMEVNGTGTPGVQYDQIVAIGTTNIANMNLVLSINYTPAVGNQITILTATARTGTFESISGLPANWFVNYTPTAVVLTYGAVLPVEMTGFTARLIEKTVQLDWQTASENNNAGFHIERSGNGFDWKEIGFVAGNGTTTVAHAYVFMDKKPGGAYPSDGIVYYRLRQADFDDAEQFSNVESVHVEDTDELSARVRVFPNPVRSGALSVFLPEHSEETAGIQLFNPAGQLVRSATMESGTATLHVGDLPAGIYSMQTTIGLREFFERVVIQR